MNQIHSDIREAIKTRGIHSLRVRISFLLILAAGILTFSISFVALNLFSNHTRAEHLKTAKGVALLAANSIQADSIETYLAQGKDVPGYQETFVYLKTLQKSIPDIKYLYVYQIKEDGCHVIFDTDEEAGDYQVNEIIEFDPTFLPLIDELLAGKEIEPLESNDQYGWLLTYYHPLFDSNGKCVCYIGIDISMDLLKQYRMTFLFRTIVLSLIAVILTVGFGIWISTKLLVKPLNGMSSNAISFMEQNGNVEGMKACVEKIKELNVSTSDEVENLYISFSRMTESMVQNIIRIKGMQEEKIGMMKKYSVELEKKVEERTRELTQEKERSESLLLNILPENIAAELTAHPDRIIAKKYPNATVLFTDIVGFTKLSSSMKAEDVVSMLNKMISMFDERAKNEGVEKIKTIGDAYMAATGLSENSDEDACRKMISYAQGLLKDVETFNAENNLNILLRIGINSGDLVAGVIGKSKFIYDVWGDTVNVASRMESTGEALKIHVSENTFEQTKDYFSYSRPVEVEVKGKGLMKTYYLQHI